LKWKATPAYAAILSELSPISGSVLWSAAAIAAGPVLTGGRLMGRYRQTKSAFEQARLSHQQTALSALREVSDALIWHRRCEEERVEQSQAVGAVGEAVGVSGAQFESASFRLRVRSKEEHV
jgi:outer membrane protein TolC